MRAAVSEVLDPSALAYVALLHFEGDECGGMDRFLAGGARVHPRVLRDVSGPQRRRLGLPRQGAGFTDGEVLDLGRHKLRFLETPTCTTGTR